MKNPTLFLLLFSACNTPVPDLSEQAKKEIIARDIAMNDLATEAGFHAALLQFADDSLYKPEEGKYPVMGKKALEAQYADKPDTKAITWSPFRAEAARSGEMGYTIGNWKMVTPDTTYYGNYFTTWKKQPDGQWKWVVDGGTNTPGASR